MHGKCWESSVRLSVGDDFGMFLEEGRKRKWEGKEEKELRKVPPKKVMGEYFYGTLKNNPATTSIWQMWMTYFQHPVILYISKTLYTSLDVTMPTTNDSYLDLDKLKVN